MRAEIISIGDGLTTGQRLETYSQWLSQQLTQLGVDVAFHTTVGDQLEDNVADFRTASERVEVVTAYPPDPSQAEARVKAIASPMGTQQLRFGCASHPAILHSRTAKQALNALRLTLLR
jgi:nicotinamide-nucleotide amidase